MDDMGLCSYCKKVHDNRVACPEYMFAQYLYEIEIKITKADLVRDKKKPHGHRNHNIKRLYFAVPHYLEDVVAEHIPERAGIVIVKRNKYGWFSTRVVRKPEDQTGYKLTDEERLAMTRLGSLRIWTYKNKIIKLMAEKKELSAKVRKLQEAEHGHLS